MIKRVKLKDLYLSSVPPKAVALDEADRHERGLAPNKKPTRRERRRAHRVRGPPPIDDIEPGYLNRRASERYLGVSSWMFGELLRKRLIPFGFVLVPGGRHFWSRRVLDDAMAKAMRSRKPRGRPLQGVTAKWRREGDD